MRSKSRQLRPDVVEMSKAAALLFDMDANREGASDVILVVGAVHRAPLNLHPLLHLQVYHFRITPDVIVTPVRYGEAFIRARSVRSPLHAVADPGDSFRPLRAAGGL
jgi:hypothetical protein